MIGLYRAPVQGTSKLPVLCSVGCFHAAGGVFVARPPLVSYIGQCGLTFEMETIIGVNFWPRVQWGLGVCLLNNLFWPLRRLLGVTAELPIPQTLG